MRDKIFFIILFIWLFAGIIIFLLNSTKIPLNSKYKTKEGIISNIKCIRPTKDWFLGEIEIFLNRNNESIKYNSPILKKDNFNEGCRSLKEQIKIGKHLKAKIYDNVVGDVLVDNIKMNDGKKTIISYNNDINIGIYIIVFAALYMTLMRIKNIKVRRTKYYKYILYAMIILAIFNFFD